MQYAILAACRRRPGFVALFFCLARFSFAAFVKLLLCRRDLIRISGLVLVKHPGKLRTLLFHLRHPQNHALDGAIFLASLGIVALGVALP